MSSPDENEKEATVSRVLGLTGDVTRWYSEYTYGLDDWKAERLLARFEPFRREFEQTLEPQTNKLEAYKKSAFAFWRTFRLAAAKPMLETITRLDPDEPHAWFWLAQLHEDALGDYDGALSRFEAFVKRWPSLSPPNNWLCDGWFSYHHAYDPSTLEALVSIGRIHRDRRKDPRRAKEYFTRAIRLLPNHHLAPYRALADLVLEEDPTAFAEALGLEQCALRAYVATEWDGLPYDRPNPDYERYEDWARQRYPFSYRWYELGAQRAAIRLAGLLAHTQDVKTAPRVLRTLLALVFPESRERARRAHSACKRLLESGLHVDIFETVSHAIESFSERFAGRDRREAVNLALDGYARLRKHHRTHPRHAETVFVHRKDYWQAYDLCEEVLAFDPENTIALRYLGLARERLHR